MHINKPPTGISTNATDYLADGQQDQQHVDASESFAPKNKPVLNVHGDMGSSGMFGNAERSTTVRSRRKGNTK